MSPGFRLTYSGHMEYFLVPFLSHPTPHFLISFLPSFFLLPFFFPFPFPRWTFTVSHSWSLWTLYGFVEETGQVICHSNFIFPSYLQKGARRQECRKGCPEPVCPAGKALWAASQRPAGVSGGVSPHRWHSSGGLWGGVLRQSSNAVHTKLLFWAENRIA